MSAEEIAKGDAYRAAFIVTDRDQWTAVKLFNTATERVVVRLASRLLSGGEVEFWRLVEAEVRK